MAGEERSSGGPIQHFWNAFRWSLKGIAATLKSETAFRQELLGAVILIPVAVVIPLPVSYRIMMVGVIFLVLIVELINSAIESIVDLVSPEYHELAGKAKDCGSAAVFFSLILTGMVWALSLWVLFTR